MKNIQESDPGTTAGVTVGFLCPLRHRLCQSAVCADDGVCDMVRRAWMAPRSQTSHSARKIFIMALVLLADATVIVAVMALIAWACGAFR